MRGKIDYIRPERIRGMVGLEGRLQLVGDLIKS